MGHFSGSYGSSSNPGFIILGGEKTLANLVNCCDAAIHQVFLPTFPMKHMVPVVVMQFVS